MAQTIDRTRRFSGRAARRLAVLLCFTAVACRTTTAATSAAPAIATTAPAPEESRPPAPSSAPSEGGAGAAVVEVQPSVLVVPSGTAYFVMRAGSEQRDDGVTWDVLYLAGYDAAELAGSDARYRLAAVARDLIGAFGPIADLEHVDRLSVTAAAGQLGGSAAVERRWFTREEAGWRADDSAAERVAAQLPALDTRVVREPEEEARARAAAASFISGVDRADYDAAWAMTSARAKAVISRVEFERHLAALPRVEADGDGSLYVSFSAPVERFLPGASIVAWLALATAAGPAVEALELRLDDDMEWRVSGVVELTAAPAPSAEVGRAPPLEPGSAL